MQIMKAVKFDERAVLPSYQSDCASGMDLVSIDETIIPPGGRQSIQTGIAVAVPSGCEGQIRPRSGLAAKYGVTVLNAPGTIDEDYRGEIKVLLINHGQTPYVVKPGDRIAQLVVCPVVHVKLLVVDYLDATERGSGGFGSTGR